MSLMYGDISVVDEMLDLCDLITQIDKKCPIPEGKLSIHLTFNMLPTYLPSVRPTTLLYKNILLELLLAYND